MLENGTNMKRLLRLLAGVVSLGVGTITAWFAVAFYQVGQLSPPDGLPAVNYPVVLGFGALGIIFLALASVFLFRSARA
jgi:hypothetical protein